MPIDSLFQPLAAAGLPKTVSVTLNGAALRVPLGTSVAAALLSAGVKRFRNSPVSGEPRAPYCMMGVCFDCLVTVNGVGNRQGCLVRVADGLAVAIQRGKRELGT